MSALSTNGGGLFVLSSMVDPTGLDASSHELSAHDVLLRGWAKYRGAGENSWAGRGRGSTGLRVGGRRSGGGNSHGLCFKVWRAMRRALRALGERASTTERVRWNGDHLAGVYGPFVY